MLLLAAAVLLQAKVTPAAVFADNMVLQRERPVTVWGSAAPGEKVTVKFAGQTLSAQAAPDGSWSVSLAPMKADSTGRVMEISGKANFVKIRNILVGEVWLCSGQSNMEMPMWTSRPRWRAIDGDKHVKAGADPQIRIVKMTPYGWSRYPRRDFVMKWSPLTAQNGLSFSATAFYFGQELRKTLKVPVGLIASHWGGTRIEPWIPAEGYRMVPELKALKDSVHAKIPGTPEYKQFNAGVVRAYEKWMSEFKKAAAAGAPQPVPPDYPRELLPWQRHQDPTVLYNRMIHPFVPFTIRGAIWYQGCSNRGDKLYGYKMQALLKGWRKVFNDPDMAFYFVQLAPYRYDRSKYLLPEMWEMQEKFASNSDKNVRMAVINDVGDLGDIHPHDKQTVGKRLSLLALKHTYGKSQLKADSPILDSWKIEGNKFILKFNNVEKWTVPAQIADFEIAGLDGRYHRADFRIDGKNIVLSSNMVKEPLAMRYLWDQSGKGRIFNEAGLPLGAFRCGKKLDQKDIISRIAKKAQLIYRHDMKSPVGKNRSIRYLVNNSGKFKDKKVKRVIFIAELDSADGKKSWVAAVMDAFTPDCRKIGVPESANGAFFACRVKNMTVLTNVPGVATGFFNEGNIEFWKGNYNQINQFKVPGADRFNFDFGDNSSPNAPAGYGSMQIHNFMKKQTVFAYNGFAFAKKDIGIGNNSGKHKDWTFAGNSGSFKKAILHIYAEFE